MEFENDLGKPWKYQDGDFTVVRSSVWSPPGCHPVGCGIKVYVDKNGKLDHIEGDENDPITQGRLCPRCLAMKDYVYNPHREVYPMKRPHDKLGDADAWERCSWDEALDLIMDKWDEITGKYGRKTMAIHVGTGRDGMLSQDFQLSIFRTPNLAYTQSGYACYQPRMMASQMVLGALYPELDYAGGLEGGYDDPQYQVPELMVIWGKAPLESNPDGFFGHSIIDLMKRGARLFSVDPRVNWLNSRSELQLRVRNGTDAALAMACCNIIISEGLYDADFVEKWTYGFDEFKERVSAMTPEKAAEICEVPVEDIYTFAREYAKAKPASIAWGLAFDQNTNGMQAGHCVLAMIAMCGNLDVPGGNIIADLSMPEDLTAEAAAGQAGNDTDTRSFITEGWYQMTDEERAECIGMDEFPLYCNQITGCQADCILDTMETDDPYPVRFGWIANTNLLAPTNSAEPSRWHDALVRSYGAPDGFAFGTDVMITPTIQCCCDVFLPISTVVEHDGVNRTHYGAASITTGVGNKAITVGEAKADLEIYCMLAKRMAERHPDDPKAQFAYNKYPEYHDYLNKNRLEGRHKFDEVKEVVKFKRKVYYKKYETGKLRLPDPDGPYRAVVDHVQHERHGPAALLLRARPVAASDRPAHRAAQEGDSGIAVHRARESGKVARARPDARGDYGEVPLHPLHGRPPLHLVPLRAPRGRHPARDRSEPASGDQPGRRHGQEHFRRPVGAHLEPVRPGKVQGPGFPEGSPGPSRGRARLVVPRAGRLRALAVRRVPVQLQ